MSDDASPSSLSFAAPFIRSAANAQEDDDEVEAEEDGDDDAALGLPPGLYDRLVRNDPLLTDLKIHSRSFHDRNVRLVLGRRGFWKLAQGLQQN